MNKDNCIEFTVLTEILWDATEKHKAWPSCLRVLFSQASYLNRKGIIPFVGLETVARETGLSVTQVSRCRERLVDAGLLTFEGYKDTNKNREAGQYLPTCIFLTGHVPAEKQAERGLTMRVCEMRNDGSLKNLEPIVIFLLQYAVEGCEGLLDFGLMEEPEDGSEPDIRSFAQFLKDAGQAKTEGGARRIIHKLRNAGVVESRQRYKKWGKGGRLAAFYFLNLPVK